ncbi:thiopurine S-methyltransferase [Pigmentibacter sp. JX0631]|uniref:thiopurine S-methyltransferase n=1 Tax=Pigmentibacter sp. JX0631 TaxID=2976982 RepID=UPI002468E65F|nr:thiopurine S-methyltransferase [Pigmentibacter sp. JX0631]WGL60982.1 thiopurine S-methyltransferase [Pigmentibacter sp. JX0631]
MDKNFWLERWEKNNIPFHLEQTNPSLVKYQHLLTSIPKSNVFLPLCGKTLDIKWLLSKNLQVTGVELSEKAIVELFHDLGVIPKVTSIKDLKIYSAENLSIYVGNIFSLTADILGSIDYIYDRAALVALPKESREKYTSHLIKITKSAEQLLITYNYDQNLMEGPPFSLSQNEIFTHYAYIYNIYGLDSFDVPNGLKGICPAKEEIWHLKKKS